MSRMTSSAAFGETLQFITSVKLEELEKQRLTYQEHARAVDEANAHDAGSVERVERLLKAVKTWPAASESTGSGADHLDLDDLELWLAQSKADPAGVPPALLRRWGDALEARVRRACTSLDYARLFGKLFTEWIESGDGSEASASPATPADADEGDEFVAVGRKEMHEQRAQLEALIFDDRTVDVKALEEYLDGLFLAHRDAENALKEIRKRVKEFGKTLTQSRISTAQLSVTIKSLLREDLLSNEKRKTLEEFSRNDKILEEVTSVLNMHLSRIGSWRWTPKEGVPIEMRRALNGKYRFYLDEEILQALLLHHLGVSWAVHFKSNFRHFLERAWKPAVPPTSKQALERRRVFLDETSAMPIESMRQGRRNSEYFMTQLPNSTTDSADYDGDASTGSTSVKQSLFDFMATECLINRAIHGSQTVLLSDLEWFGPSLRFDAILTVMKYFGVPDDWLSFFKTFLEAPLRFKGDAAGAAPRVRKCGVPISHQLSALFGETLLFVMDYSVNQRAEGLFLYRIHDDLWLWSPDSAKVAAGWDEMQRYAKLVGLTINEKKTGAVTLGGKHATGLPTGDVTWGFLRLDTSSGSFVIDDAKVDEHIAELRRQLGATRSVFGFVNAYNHYVRFIARNLGGRPANAFGAVHVDAMIKTLARVQSACFPDEAEGVVGQLRELLRKRFDADKIPLGWFFFPNAMGGLGLRNPLVELFALKKDMVKDPAKEVREQIEKDGDALRLARERWETLDELPAIARKSNSEYHKFDMELDEYVAGRERHIGEWGTLYNRLLQIASPHVVTTSATVAGVDVDLVSDGYYQQWLLAMYEEEMVQTFGDLEIVDPQLIPVGMVDLFRQTRISWEQ